MLVIDGAGCVLGRLGSRIAKELLKGETVVLINADKIVISGNLKDIVGKYMTRRRIQTHQRPELKPRYPRVPHLFVKRLIRGMLPWKSKRGKDAFKRLKVYTEPPEDLKEVKPIKIQLAEKRNLRKSVTVLEVCKRLGYNPR